MMPGDFFFPFSLPQDVCLAVIPHGGSDEGLALSAAEETRIARLKIAGQGDELRRSLTRRRCAIAEMTGHAAEEIELGWTAEGAPLLLRPEGWSISVSAVEGLTAVALAPAGTALGVDLSLVRGIGWRPMLEMVSAPEEAAAFCEAFEGEAALAAFHRLWAIKEAVLKATGRGMRAGAKNVAVATEWLAAPAAAFSLQAFGQRYSGVCGEAGGAAIAVVAGLPQG